MEVLDAVSEGREDWTYYDLCMGLDSAYSFTLEDGKEGTHRNSRT